MFIFSSRRRHTRYIGDWSSDVCSSDLAYPNWDPVDREFDRRNLADGVLVLERGHEQPAVTPVDARFDEVVQMPHESPRSEERRVGKEWGTKWGRRHNKRKTIWKCMGRE